MAEVSYSIDIVGLSKRFRRATMVRSGYTTLKSSLLKAALSPFRKADLDDAHHYTQAIKDLTVRVPKGASVGIIGQNGSGKSTLLKLITGIYKPDCGKVDVNGRVAALIELGAGFHPDFTGRENLQLGGVMHGLTREEIAARFDRIVEFAELEDVIDDPVRTYSSGMFMRLGFSLAVHTDPDVLIIDEVLAVGDASFVAKCKEKITRLRAEGKTLLLVSHDLPAVERWCDEAIWLHKGEVKDRGNPRRVIDHYREFVEKGEETELEKSDAVSKAPVEPAKQPVDAPVAKAASQDVTRRWGSREIEITGIKLFSADGLSHHLFHTEDPILVELSFKTNNQDLHSSKDVVFGVCIRRTDGLVVHGTNTEIEGVEVPLPSAGGTVRFQMPRNGLLEGQYFLDVAVHKKDGYSYDYHQGALTFSIKSPLKQVGVYAPRHNWSFGG